MQSKYEPTELVRLTRFYSANQCLECIDEAVNDEVYINDIDLYIIYKMDVICDYLNGEYDHGLGFWQTKHWLETGECIPILQM